MKLLSGSILVLSAAIILTQANIEQEAPILACISALAGIVLMVSDAFGKSEDEGSDQ